MKRFAELREKIVGKEQAYMAAHPRAMRLFDGPDEVHRQQIARLELKRQIGWPKTQKAAE